MAMVTSAYRLVVSFTESSGKSVQRTYEADPTGYADFAAFLTDIQTAGTGFLDKLDALTQAVISSWQASIVVVEDALVLPTNVENQTQALLAFKIDGDPTDSGNLSIPAPVDLLFVNTIGEGRDVVDTSYAPLLAWLQEFTAAGGQWTVSDGEQIEITTLKGRRRSVKASGT